MAFLDVSCNGLLYECFPGPIRDNRDMSPFTRSQLTHQHLHAALRGEYALWGDHTLRGEPVHALRGEHALWGGHALWGEPEHALWCENALWGEPLISGIQVRRSNRGCGLMSDGQTLTT